MGGVAHLIELLDEVCVPPAEERHWEHTDPQRLVIAVEDPWVLGVHLHMVAAALSSPGATVSLCVSGYCIGHPCLALRNAPAYRLPRLVETRLYASQTFLSTT